MRSARPCPGIVCTSLLLSSLGCVGELHVRDDDDWTGSGVASEPIVVVDGLLLDEPTRYSAQRKLVSLGGDALLLAYHDGSPGMPDAFVDFYVTVSGDRGDTWSAPTMFPSHDFDRLGFGAVAARDGHVVVAQTIQTGAMQGTGIFVRTGAYPGTGAELTWTDPEEVTPRVEGAEFSFPSLVIDRHEVVHLVARANTVYDEHCDPEHEACPQELRQVHYVTQQGGTWAARQISEQWTSTVPEIALAEGAGTDGPDGARRLWSRWHHEDRPDLPVGCMTGDVSLWTLDLDSGDESLDSVPGSHEGEACDALVKSAALPALAIGPQGRPGVIHALIDDEYRTAYRYQSLQDDLQSWSDPESILPDNHALDAGASLGFVEGQPVVTGMRVDTTSGQVVAFTRTDDGWNEQILHQADEHHFNWINISRDPLFGPTFGLVYGRDDALIGEGTLYFQRFPDP